MLANKSEKSVSLDNVTLVQQSIEWLSDEWYTVRDP